MDSDADSEREEESRPIKGQKMIYMPSKEEWDNHMRSHIPFRKWCPYCVRGKCMAGAHKSSPKTQEELDRETAIIAIEYMKQKSKEGNMTEIDALQILTGIDRKKSWHMAMMVPHKGVDPFAIKALGREIELAGYRRLIIKSDQEPSILELIQAVK